MVPECRLLFYPVLDGVSDYCPSRIFLNIFVQYLVYHCLIFYIVFSRVLLKKINAPAIERYGYFYLWFLPD